MNIRHGLQLGLALLVALAGCAPGTETTAPGTSAPPAPSEPSPTPTVQDIMELGPFAPLEPGTYFIDPDGDPSTPLRVVYEVPAEGWSMWIGAAKFADDGHVNVSITTVTNLVRAWVRRSFVGRSSGRTKRRRPRDRIGGPGPVQGDVAPEGRDHLRLPRQAPGADRARPPGRARGRRPPFHRMRGRQAQELGRVHRRSRRRGRVLRLHGPWLQGGVLDPRRRRDPSDDRGRASPGSPPKDVAEQRAILDSIRIEP